MSLQLFTDKFEVTTKNGFDQLLNHIQGYVIGREEITYRVEVLSKVYNTTDVVNTETLKTKPTIYNSVDRFNSTDLPKVKLLDAYTQYAIYLAVNYVLKNEHVISYVDRCWKKFEYRTEHVNNIITENRNSFHKESYDYFNQISVLAFASLKNFLNKQTEFDKSLICQISELLFKKCIMTSFNNVIVLYSYDKTSTFGFSSITQRQFYMSDTINEGEEIVINRLYEICVPAKKKVAAKGTAKPRATKKKVKNSVELSASDGEADDFDDSDVSDNSSKTDDDFSEFDTSV